MIIQIYVQDNNQRRLDRLTLGNWGILMQPDNIHLFNRDPKQAYDVDLNARFG